MKVREHLDVELWEAIPLEPIKLYTLDEDTYYDVKDTKDNGNQGE